VYSTNFNEIVLYIENILHSYKHVYYVESKRSQFADLSRMQFGDKLHFVEWENLLKTVKSFRVDADIGFIVDGVYISSIPDRNLGALQRAFGDKIIFENHPFASKSEVYYCYFAYSLVDKTLLGYPHNYAFRDAMANIEYDPFNIEMLASHVFEASDVYIQSIFDIDKIQFVQMNLSDKEHKKYQVLKKSLFESEVTAHSIISKLHRFVNNTESMQAVCNKHYNLLYPNRIFDQYRKGLHACIYSDAKVDLYLLAEFKKYISNANEFMQHLWGFCNGH